MMETMWMEMDAISTAWLRHRMSARVKKGSSVNAGWLLAQQESTLTLISANLAIPHAHLVLTHQCSAALLALRT